MKNLIRKIISTVSLAEGDFVRVTNLKKIIFSKHHEKVLKSTLKRGKGKLKLVSIEGDIGYIASDVFDSYLGTIKVPLKYLTKVYNI